MPKDGAPAHEERHDAVQSTDKAMAVSHLAAIVDSSEDAIVSKNLDGTVLTWNSAAETLFGYEAAEIIGRPILTIIPEDRHLEEEMILGRIRRGERIERFETVRRRKDGSLIEVSLTVSPIRNEQGVVIGASKIARDIRDRLAAESANAHLASIVESSDDAIVSKTLDGIIQSWNSGAERLFGYMAEEVIGKPINILLPPDRQEEETRILSRLRKGDRVDHFETVRLRKDGTEVHVSVSISPVRDRLGRVIGASKVARDISDRKVFEATTLALAKDLEQRVRERTLELELAHKEMESFTYSIAHDLRGPIRAIISTCAILNEDYGENLPQEGLEMLARQIASAKQLSRLIDDLLMYSRLGRSALAPSTLDLSELARDVQQGFNTGACQVEVQEGLVAFGDRSLIRLLLQNLLDNACKFSPEGGVVEVGQTGSAFFVRDHGMGFDMAYAEKIFIPFERLVRNDEVPGTGIGLASVKRIVELHGGSVWANSSLGEGTTFYFTLPDPA